MNTLWLVLAVFAAALAGVLVGVMAARRMKGPRPVASEAAGGGNRSPGTNAATGSAHGEEPALGPLGEAVDDLRHGIVIANGGGEIVFRNRAATRLATARHGHSLVEDCVKRMLAGAQRGGSTSEEVELFGPPAELFVVSAHPFVDGAGTGAIAVVEDRSDARRTETVRRDFVANISHELKTPIGALGLLAETIETESDPEVMRRLAARMVSESERASHTIDDLLELSRIEFEDDTARDDVELEGVVGEAVARIATAAEQNGIEVLTDVPDGVRIQGDQRQLVSAVFNLLDNAVKYSAPGAEVQVLVRAPDNRGDAVTLSVVDHGIGIPRRSVERVFERFYRVDRARSRNTGGTGLGLAIVRHVVHNHGGTVLVSSTEGRGSVFTLELPALADPGADSSADSNVGARPGAHEVLGADPPGHEVRPGARP
ncbi:MAG: sensor histidine kinase [Microthrixaceae bacterium]